MTTDGHGLKGVDFTTRAIVTREQAATRRLATYYDGVACVRGHVGSERYTANGTCCRCHALGKEGRAVDGDLRGLNITARTAAKSANALTYSTGAPCLRGHYADRYVSTGGCVECLRLTQPRRPTDGWIASFVHEHWGARLAIDDDGHPTIGGRLFQDHDLTGMRVDIELRTKLKVSARALAPIVRCIALHLDRAGFAVRIDAAVSPEHRELFAEHMQACVDAFTMQHNVRGFEIL